MKLIASIAWTDLILGAWLLAAPSVIGYQATRPAGVVEDLLPGIFLCVTSCVILLMKWRPQRLEWLQAICGIWLLAGSIALAVYHLPHAALNGMLVGVAVTGLSLAAWAWSDFRPTGHHHQPG